MSVPVWGHLLKVTDTVIVTLGHVRGCGVLEYSAVFLLKIVCVCLCVYTCMWVQRPEVLDPLEGLWATWCGCWELGAGTFSSVLSLSTLLFYIIEVLGSNTGPHAALPALTPWATFHLWLNSQLNWTTLKPCANPLDLWECTLNQNS